MGAVTLPFLGKAFHIDDTFFHRVTENVVRDPMDPYAGEIDWWHRPAPIFRSDSNPPLLNYYLAPFSARTEAPEFALHAAMVPFYLLLAVSILALGRQDVDVSAIRPRADVDVIGASSDHLILEAQDPGLDVGEEVAFDVGYGALLRAMTSPYVEKVYRPGSAATIRSQRSRDRHRQKRQHVLTAPGAPS